ncbi:MAG: bifunctional 4-hydroxy-2-oxoglutarate aldolase/2-dehydro-3-deoxy-phosphogluconate aldolase [Terriglobales bacterium]
MPSRETLSAAFQDNIITVVRGATAAAAEQAVDLLVAAGLPIVEITLTVPNGLKVLERALDRHGDRVIFGAGSVLDVESCRAALLAGARFIVSPNTNAAVIEMAKRYSAVSIPGALTPTEIVAAWERGADLVKVFPCDPAGGPRYLKLLKGPLPQVRMVAAGGTSPATAAAYFAAGADAIGIPGYPIGGGSWPEAEANARALAEVLDARRGAPVAVPAGR